MLIYQLKKTNGGIDSIILGHWTVKILNQSEMLLPWGYGMREMRGMRANLEIWQNILLEKGSQLEEFHLNLTDAHTQAMVIFRSN